MITDNDKQKLQEWLEMNLQYTSKSNVELIVRHIDHYFQSPVLNHEQEDGWVKVEDRLPEVKKGKECSENVFAICEGRLKVMAYCYIESEEAGGWVWCDCYGDIYGDAEFDDNYNVTHWRPLPTAPK